MRIPFLKREKKNKKLERELETRVRTDVLIDPLKSLRLSDNHNKLIHLMR